jgi:3-phenylpropionate/trans-cinnamate dioxygenase ferredoxin reductase subunit
MLSHRQPYRAVPYFWTRQFDVSISYVGHGAGSLARSIHGSLEARDAAVVYRDAGNRIAAVATVGRDRLSLETELAMEMQDHQRLEQLFLK